MRACMEEPEVIISLLLGRRGIRIDITVLLG